MMHHHLSRLLKHRLLPPAAFSTSSKRPYARRTIKSTAVAPTKQPAEKAREDAAAPAALAVGDGAASWKMEKELPRPSTVPLQPRVANVVHLVGTVGAPVQMQRTPDGRFFAVSVLVQDRRVDFPKFWIPIIFQDDLAQIASSHLKENDHVYVSGQLTGDAPPFELTDGQANILVLANLLQFVDSKASATDAAMDEEEGFMEVVEDVTKFEAKQFSPKYPPGTISEEGFMEVVEDVKKFEAKQFSPKYPPGTVSGYRSKEDKLNKLWNDVIARPQDWTDNRPLKKTGSRGAKYPDFKNKVSREALWLNTAPKTVLEKLDDLAFGTGYDAGRSRKPLGGDTRKGFDTNMMAMNSQDTSVWSKQKLEEDLWRDLVDNPANWWDNRSDKRTPTYPDFKHKESGKALWIGTRSPQWVVHALPSLKF